MSRRVVGIVFLVPVYLFLLWGLTTIILIFEVRQAYLRTREVVLCE